jgi:hypothetical protein
LFFVVVEYFSEIVGVDRRAHKLKDHNNMVRLEKTERAIKKNRKTTDTVNIGHKT